MKSVSFSDLRDSSGMSNFDANMKRSSSIKQLTYYSSPEDILRRFSTKTSDIILSKDSTKPEENKPEPVTKISAPTSQSLDEDIADYQLSSSDQRTIKELRDQLTQKNNTIAKLQDEHLLLQTESTKNSEQVIFLENRIKYLEHMMAAFTSNSEDKGKSSETIRNNEQFDRENIENNYNNLPTSTKSKPIGSRVNFDVGLSSQESKNSNFIYSRNRISENESGEEKGSDLRKRPTSADSTLQNNYQNFTNAYEAERYYQPRQSSMKLYDSDSEQNLTYPKFNSANDNQKPAVAQFMNFQRQKLERDRSVNLSEFKSRLDDFTKYARRSAEQNSLRHSTSSLSPSNEYKQPQKSTNIDKWVDSSSKTRLKSANSGSRPPIDPYHKQRKNNSAENQLSNEPMMNLSSTSQSTMDEDVILKERVKKILEKHNYPINNSYYTNVMDNVSNNPGTNIGYRDELTKPVSYKKYAANDTSKTNDWRYSNPSMQYGSLNNSKIQFSESNIPRLDLTLYNHQPSYPDDTSDLLEKYLNYQGYANVS